MTMETDRIAMRDGADMALMGGENIAAAAKTMFGELEAMNYDMVGTAGNAFARVQTVMMSRLDTIDKTLNQVGNGIISADLDFSRQDDDNNISIDQAIGGDETFDQLTKGN